MNVQIHCIVALTLLWCSILPSSRGMCHTIEDLPPDKSTALRRVSQGEIDSALWELIEPFYDDPLEVSTGELSVLTDIFSHLRDRVPDKHQLQYYQPWSFADQQRFWRDYPDLASFSPILSFSRWTDRGAAMVRVDSRLKPYRNEASQTARFTVSNNKSVTGKGTARFDKQTVRWYRRSLSVELGRHSVQIGNFSGHGLHTLTYGRFGKDSASDSNQEKNWLYGSSQSWNGIYVSLPFASGLHLRGVYHARPTEQILWLSAKASVSQRCAVTAGLSHNRYPQKSDRTLNLSRDVALGRGALGAHLGILLTENFLSVHLFGDFLSTCPRSIPVSGMVSIRHEKAKIIGSVTHFPASVELPLSRDYRRLCSAVKSEKNHTAMTEIQLQPSFTLHDYLQLKAQYRFSSTADRYRFNLTNHLSSSKPLNLSLRYRCMSSEESVIQRVSLNHLQSISKERLYYSVRPSVRFENDTLSDVEFETSFSARMFSAVFMSPKVHFRRKPGTVSKTKAGLVVRIDLFEKNFGSYGLYTFFDNKNYRGFEFEGQTSFCF